MEQDTDPDLAFIIRRHNYHLSLGTYEEPTGIALQAADSASCLVIVRALVKGGRYSGVTGTTLTKRQKKNYSLPDATGAVSRLLH